MKKYFTFGLMMSLMSGACFAQHPMIAQLIAEKQSKMEKLEKCQGTTKKLKIAGLSTLGITAVGIGANIAEAVVLNNAKEDVAKAQKAHDEQQTIKNEREAAEKKRQEEERQRLLEEDKRRQECENKHAVYANGVCGKCKEGYITDTTGNCVEKPKPDEKQDNQGDGDKQGNKKADNQGAQDDGDKQGDKKSGDKGNAGQGGKEQNEAKKGGAGEPAPAGGESDTDESEPEEAPQKSDEELFTEACVNAGYHSSIYSSSLSFVCAVCHPSIGTANIPNSKAYVDNALITAARKMNVGCSGAIYTEPNEMFPENQDSYIDCVGGKLYCFHNKIDENATPKQQAKDLLVDIKDENRWKKWKEEIKQVEVPYAPTPEQVKQSEPKVSQKPEVQKNIERADEIINNKLPCKSDERFDYIMNACVKGTETEEDCPAPKYKYAEKCFSNQTILDTYCKGSEAKQTSMGKLRCSIDLSKERYATEQDGINRARQWGAHIPLLSDCKAYVHYVGDDTVVCTVGQVEFQFTFDALNAKPEKRETQQVTGLFSAKKDIAKQLCTESKLYAAGSGYYYCDLSEAECQQLNNNDKGLQATYTELGHGYGTHCWVY